MQNEPRIPRRCSIFPGCTPHPPRPSRRWGAVAALVVLAAVLGIAPPEDARAQTLPSPDTERDALAALYTATGGANWTDSTNWLDDDMELGDWHGVTTNTAGKVTGLTLVGNNLRGSLPAKLGNLVNLMYLYLHQNTLRGAIPPELGNLENLTHLLLHQNTLSEEIPPELEDLNKLKQLHLQGNKLSGSIPPTLGLSSLVDLKLHSNAALSGPLPASFPTAMPSLRVLGVQNTGVTIPQTPAFTAWTARITSGTQTSSRVITLDAANTRPSGLWADDTTLYVVGEDGGKVYAYTLAGGVRDSAALPCTRTTLVRLGCGRTRRHSGCWTTMTGKYTPTRWPTVCGPPTRILRSFPPGTGCGGGRTRPARAPTRPACSGW